MLWICGDSFENPSVGWVSRLCLCSVPCHHVCTECVTLSVSQWVNLSCEPGLSAMQCWVGQELLVVVLAWTLGARMDCKLILPLSCLFTASLLVPLALSLCPRSMICMEGLHSFLTPRSPGGIRGRQGKDGGMTCSLSSSCHSPIPRRPRWSPLYHTFWGSSFSAYRETQLNTGFILCPFWSETGRASDCFLISVKSLSAALMLFPWCYTHPINSPTSGFCALRPSEAEFYAFWQNPDQQTTFRGRGVGVWQDGKDQTQRLGRKLRLTLKTACVF